MKKIISLAVCFVMPFVLMGAKTAEDTPPTTSAQAFVLYCPDNNTVICSKNADEKMKPASTTKIMTSLITLEEAASCNSEVTFKQEMVAEGSSMYLKVGTGFGASLRNSVWLTLTPVPMMQLLICPAWRLFSMMVPLIFRSFQ